MSTANDGRRKHVMITDLDQSDEPQHQPEAKPSKKRISAKTLHTISGNFSRRSRSAECHIAARANAAAAEDVEKKREMRVNSQFNELLQAKDKQMEKLLQRLATLHKFNEQFAEENVKLRTHTQTQKSRIKELEIQVEHCSRCRQLEQQLAESNDTQRVLQVDVEMMKTLVYRLNVQIESYQDRLRIIKAENSNGAAGDAPSPLPATSSISPWSTGPMLTHTLSPLLQSYDEMIRDKEQLLQQYRQEFEHFTGELKRVLEENNRLLQQNEGLRREVDTWREERTRLQAQVEVCRTKAEGQTRKSDLAKEKLIEVMHCYEQKLQSLVLDMEHLQTAYARTKSELTALKSVNEKSPDSLTNALQQCKELLDQLKQQHSKEKQTLEHTIAELSAKCTSQNEQATQLQQQNTTLSKELEQQRNLTEELQRRTVSLLHTAEKVKRSRDRLKARLRIALQWAQKLEEGQTNLQNTWDALKRLETIVKHKESQVRGLHARHLQEIDKMQKKLEQKEETIRSILKSKLDPAE